MNIEKVIDKAKQLGCYTYDDKLLKDYTTFKIGGRCKALIEINSEESIAELVKICNDENIRYLILGKGSNMLCDDKGFEGVVLHIGTNFSSVEITGDDILIADAGCNLSKLCKIALDNSLSGLEFAYGIPGTVGGAVFMNAGAYGGEIKDILQEVNCVDNAGNIHTLSAEKLNLSYRHSIFHDNGWIVTSAAFKLKKGSKEEIKSKMDDLIGRRKDKQPLEYPNAGSTFKRPVGQFAGKLIQDCGLKGFSVGGAMVSEKHSGFVINYNNATCEDVLSLIKQVQDIVKEKTGFFLECEVKIIPYE